MIRLLDKDGKVVCEVSEEMFPLRMPVETKVGERIYHLHIYWEDDEKRKEARSALLNTRP